MNVLNPYGQPVGPDLDIALPRPRPQPVVLEGNYIRVRPLAVEDAGALFDRLGGSDRAPLWTYMPVGPFFDPEEFRRWLETAVASRDPLFLALEDIAGGRPLGFASLLRIAPETAVVEVGFIMFSRALQGTAAATEAMAMLMRHVFEDLGYRRYEWKCDALNAPSRRAAGRLGFRYEGTFRQATVYKGRNRDTAWFSVLDSEWPALSRGFAQWLAPENFDAMGRQIRRLEACRGG